jgi:triacylglycerol lipase
MLGRLLLPLAAVVTAFALPACSGSTEGTTNTNAATAIEADAPPLFVDPSGFPAKYPIVLMHGFNASPTNDWSFYQVADALEADGQTVYEAEVPPFDSSTVRAQALAPFIDRVLSETGSAKVNLVAHSMGGLDARVLIDDLGYGDRVASLTTISTPHRGSQIADVALGILPGSSAAALDALASAYGSTFNDLASNSHLLAAFQSLAETNADAFNAAHPDDSRVYYQSWAGVSSILGIANRQDDVACEGKRLTYEGRSAITSAALSAGQVIVSHGTEELPSDGMSMVSSAKWGNFRGCIPGDHLREVGQVKKVGPDARTGFDHLPFYRTLAFDLAARGF